MSISLVLVYVAATTFVLGWLIVIADAISGFRLIEKLPQRFLDPFWAIHKWAWVSVGVCVLALAIVALSGVAN